MNTLTHLTLIVTTLALAPGLIQAAGIPLNSDPSGATVRVLNVETTPQRGKTSQWVTPATVALARNRSGEPYVLEFSKTGFESVQVTLDLRAKSGPIAVTLPPLSLTREFSFNSSPTGAQVLLGARVLGTTPCRARIEFQRPDAGTPWTKAPIRFHLDDHQDEGLILTQDRGQSAVEAELARLHDPRELVITATNADQQPVERAVVEIDGEKVGLTPAKVPLSFRRSDKSAEWSQFKIVVHIPDEYQPVERTLTVNTPSALRFELTPVVEMNVIRHFPGIEMTGRGPRILVDTSSALGTATDDRDENSPAESTVRITNHERKQATIQAVNSFAITPDGQNVVYAVTAQTEDGRFYSNLFMRSTNPSNSSVVRLTSGPRYLDCYPSMSREEGSNLVVFQSNRSGIETFDISSFRIQDGRLIGGIQQLTREARFNYRPSFASEARPIFFTSLEEFPQADPRIASVRTDGSAYTNLGELGDMLNYAESGRLYFARPAEDTKRFQLYSILADGTGIETILNDFNFTQANCRSPSLSPDGERLLFVSDYNPDRAARKDNNIWLLDLAGTRQPLQITTNTSDDVMPVWSPTEPDIIYFLSNRRGAYNVWQMRFTVVR